MRDPVFYRCKDVPHHRTGAKYKAYPTYDLTVPIVDSIEGVTHALRTIEYRDRNPLYEWVQKVLELRPVKIYDFSKLCMASTVLSKRKLAWFVNENLVEGWNDPRFPTVQGIMRKGMTIDALKEFMLEQGPSQNNNLMEWDKIWATNKKAIDPIAPRYTCISKDSAVKLVIENGPEPVSIRTTALHPKNEAIGSKAVSYGRDLWIERDDAKDIVEGEKITLMKWGNATVSKRVEENGSITLFATVDEKDTDFKKTKKLTWLCADPATTIQVKLVEYAHLIDKQKIEENDKVEDLVNKNSRLESLAYAEGSVRNIQKGDIIQYERRGFYICDKLGIAGQLAQYIFIPDGKAKAMSTITHQVDAAEQQKGKGEIKKGKNQPAATGEDGEEKLSKKQLKKLEEAAKKDKAKANKAAGIEPEPKQPKGKPAQKQAPEERPVQLAGAQGKHVDQLDMDLQKQ